MKILDRFTLWLETHWVNPAYSGWLMGGLAGFFFAAATNTMAGWLYAISGSMVAILTLAAVLSIQTLRGVRLARSPIAPVSVGDPLVLELIVENQTNQLKTLLQLQDDLPQPLTTIRTAIEQIPARQSHHWVATVPTHQRGVYRWQTAQFRTAAPLGLFWCRRIQHLQAKAIVYPTILPLTHCPIIDQLGQETKSHLSSYHQSHLATEGLTRTLRPYRWGDSTRLIHWRSSARYGELRIRELETYTGGQELVIGLDSAIAWDPTCFEQAVVAAASLYFYALQRRLRVGLWTANTGLLRGSDQIILETLAAVQPLESTPIPLPQLPLLWLTQRSDRLTTLPSNSRWLLWQHPQSATHIASLPASPGLLLQSTQPLQLQLQSPPKSSFTSDPLNPSNPDPSRSPLTYD